jgi:hypothetical protein
MDKNKPQTWNVTENRFRAVLMFLRIGGVPINTKNASLLHTTYNTLLAIDSYALYIAILTEVTIQTDDLRNFMKTFRVLNSSSIIYWLHLNLRYIIYESVVVTIESKCSVISYSATRYLHPGMIYSDSVVTLELYTQNPIPIRDRRGEFHFVIDCACDKMVKAGKYDTLLRCHMPTFIMSYQTLKHL